MGTSRDIMVTVLCIVYNHEPYLRECLEGIVTQETNFKFQVIIHDDCSTDNSADIIREYASKYSDLIIPIFEEENVYAHVGAFDLFLRSYIKGKYFAYCEGDDYWCDKNKLQLQYDFLERFPDYTYCSTNFDIYNQEDKSKINHHIKTDYRNMLGFTFHDINVNNYFKCWSCSPLTSMCRNINYYTLKDVRRFSRFYDLVACYFYIKKGKGALLENNTAVYRIHNKGIYSGNTTLNNYKIEIDILQTLYIFFHDQPILKDGILPRMIGMIGYCRKNKRYKTMFNEIIRFCIKMPMSSFVLFKILFLNYIKNIKLR